MNKLRIVSYNIDGLPEKLNLADLPWYLTPIAWVYKVIKGTTEIRINDGSDRAEKIEEISEYLNSLNPDIIAVQEDFNFHKELMSSLTDYYDETHTGDISLKNLMSKTTWRPLPRFKADGLGLIWKRGRGFFPATEDIVCWNKSNGYTNHANDKLTHKGFRLYKLMMGRCWILLYVLHMDADFYHPEKCPDISKDVEARRSQILQLLEHIAKNRYYAPVIIVGDTNSTDSYPWDEKNIQLLLSAGFTEVKPAENSVDRLFYMDGAYDKIYSAKAELGIKGLSDHRPLIVDLELDVRGNG